MGERIDSNVKEKLEREAARAARRFEEQVAHLVQEERAAHEKQEEKTRDAKEANERKFKKRAEAAELAVELRRRAEMEQMGATTPQVEQTLEEIEEVNQEKRRHEKDKRKGKKTKEKEPFVVSPLVSSFFLFLIVLSHLVLSPLSCLLLISSYSPKDEATTVPWALDFVWTWDEEARNPSWYKSILDWRPSVRLCYYHHSISRASCSSSSH